jgi:hypothetical protein
MILDDPVLNFLNLLVGIAGGWALGDAIRAWGRPGTWAPVLSALRMAGAAALVYLLYWTLGLGDRVAEWPVFVGTIAGTVMRVRGARR